MSSLSFLDPHDPSDPKNQLCLSNDARNKKYYRGFVQICLSECYDRTFTYMAESNAFPKEEIIDPLVRDWLVSAQRRRVEEAYGELDDQSECRLLYSL
jgi:hypothetical protein